MQIVYKKSTFLWTAHHEGRCPFRPTTCPKTDGYGSSNMGIRFAAVHVCAQLYAHRHAMLFRKGCYTEISDGKVFAEAKGKHTKKATQKFKFAELEWDQARECA